MSCNSVCPDCRISFKRFADLRKHVKKFHPEKLNDIAPIQVKKYAFPCGICSKSFKHHRTLKQHMKIHPSVAAAPTAKNTRKKCPVCDYYGTSNTEFYGHFESAHNIIIESETSQFSTTEEFSSWLSDIEKTTKTKFVKARGSTTTTINYVCHRSGVFKTRGMGKRNLKAQGTKKINGFCPASINVCVDEEGKYRASFIKTHVGHQNELAHLFLTAEERSMLATQIAAKIPFDVILDKVRDTVSTSSLERIHIVNKKDLFNIEGSFNLHSTAVRHSNDAISGDAWVQEKKDSYEPQGCVLEEYLQVGEDDFISIIMAEGNENNLADDKRIEESERLFEALSRPGNSSTFSEKKRALIEGLLKELNSIDNDEELMAVQKIVNPVAHTLRAIRQNLPKSSLPKLSEPTAPHNKNVLQQRRLYSTKKKSKKPKKAIVKQTPVEEVISIKLLH